jgi:hypothetical protein
MTIPFEKMKKKYKSGEAFNAVRGANIQIAGREIRKRVITALYKEGDIEGLILADRIKQCGRGALCGSVYCMDCRGRAAKGLKDRLSDRILLRFGNDEASARDELRYVTVLCELTEFNLDSVKSAVTRARTDLKAMKRRFPDIWIQGSFEFELIDMKLLGQSGAMIKLETLAAMMDLDVSKSKSLGHRVIVHFHVLVDLNSVRDEAFKKWVRDRWSKHNRQTDVKRIRKNQKLSDMIAKVSDYGFKNRSQYNLSFETLDFKKGKWFKDADLGRLAAIYDGIGKRGYSSLLISLGGR